MKSLNCPSDSVPSNRVRPSALLTLTHDVPPMTRSRSWAPVTAGFDASESGAGVRTTAVRLGVGLGVGSSAVWLAGC